MEVQFVTTTQELLHTVPIVDGQVIAIANDCGYYYDMLNIRYRVSNPLYIDDVTPTENSLYSSSKVQKMIDAINSFELEVVDALPNVGDDHKIYFLKKADVSGNDYCDEYIYIGSEWELIGHTKVTYNPATETDDGLMSAHDKAKLDGIAEGAQVGTITGIRMNGSLLGDSGVVDLGNIETSETSVKHPKNDPVGSATQGIYVKADGSASVMRYSVECDVPKDAVFTDTVTSVTTEGTGNVVVGLRSSEGQIIATLGEVVGPDIPELEAKADKVLNTPGTAGITSNTSGSSIVIPYVSLNHQGVITGYGTRTHSISEIVDNILSKVGTVIKNEVIPSGSSEHIISSTAIEPDSIVDVYYSEAGKHSLMGSELSYVLTDGQLTINISPATTEDVEIDAIKISNY